MQLITHLSSFFSARILRFTLVGLLAFLLLGPIGYRDHSITYTGWVSMAWADETKKTDKNATDEMVENMVAFLNIILGVLTFLITPLVMLAGWLLSPDWTFGEIFGLRVVFHNIWILISNVVYVIFAFILVTIAFMNIFWGGHDHAYEIKKALPKLVVSILIVPFTWFIVSAVLSIANVLTASVIQLPFDMLSQTTNGKTILGTKMIPKNIVYNHNVDYGTGSLSKGDTKNQIDADAQANGNFIASDCNKGDDSDCLTLEQFITSGDGGAYNLVSAYAYGIFRIQDYKAIKDTELKWLKTTWDIVKKLIFWALFFIIFGILVIAIVYALFSRALMLWGFAMFSPLFALNYFFEHVKMGEKAKKSIEEFTISKFISLALVPVYVAAALAFGLMFVGSVVNMPDSSGGSDTIAKITSVSDSTTFAIGWVTLKTIGLLSGENLQNAKGVLKAWGNIIGTIIVNVLALVILWMAVMAALKADDITGAAVKPISDMGDELGKLMKHAPQYMPLPLPGGMHGQSMKSMAQGLQGVKWGIEQWVANKAWEVTRRFWLWWAADRGSALTGLWNAVTQGDAQAMNQKFHAFKNTYGSYNEFIQDGKAHEMMRKLWQKLEVDEAIRNADLSNASNMTKLLDKIDHKLKAKGQHLFGRDDFGHDNGYMVGEFERKTGAAAAVPNPNPATPTPVTINVQTNGNIRTLAIPGTNGAAERRADINTGQTAQDNATALNALRGLVTKEELRNSLRNQNLPGNLLNELIQELERTGFFITR